MSCLRTQCNDAGEARIGGWLQSQVKQSTTEPLRSRLCLEGFGSWDPIDTSLSILIFSALDLLVQAMERELIGSVVECLGHGLESHRRHCMRCVLEQDTFILT